MSEFHMENWDLQAVVGGSGINFNACVSDMEIPEFVFDQWSFKQEDVLSFPEIFEPNPKVLDELQELYKPFCPEFFAQTIISSSLSVPRDHSDEPAENQKGQQSVSDQSATHSAGTNKGSSQTANKPKRSSRKNQQNRVVQQVTADGLSSDKWAWRKYGQKPIKGSPYPRSYYRCSSSKGCLARKQVERSCSDPGTFIITYTAEHSHGHPSRRNSLAGSTRSRSKSSSSSSTTPKSTLLANKKGPAREAAEILVVSPTAIKDEITLQQDHYQSIIKMEEQEQLQLLEDIGEGDKILRPDIMLSHELVQSLGNFEGLFLDQFSDLSNELWSMNESATLTGSCLLSL